MTEVTLGGWRAEKGERQQHQMGSGQRKGTENMFDPRDE